VEVIAPRANQPSISLPAFRVATRENGQVDRTWANVVACIEASANHQATYSQILRSLGFQGDADGARKVRRALSWLILGEIPGAPQVIRLSRGVYGFPPAAADQSPS